MATMHEVEVYVMVDHEGNYVAHEDPAELAAAFAERVADDLVERDGFRVVKLTLKVPLPTLIELRGEVAADQEVGELKAG